MAQVSLRKVVKDYDDDAQAVSGIDLEIADKEFVVLVGPSGCGKSTTLRMIAGLEEINSGEICDRWRRRQRRAAQGPRHRHGVPELRALSAYDGVREHVVRPAAQALAKDEIKRRVEDAARILDITELLSASRGSSRAASGSASRWAVRSCATRRSFCSTSPCRIWTPSCACRCARRSSACIRRSRPRRST